MRTILMTLAAAATAVIVLPLAAMADSGPPSAADAANAICTGQLSSLGQSAFATLYGTNKSKSNAFGQCVAKNGAAAATDVNNAAAACKAEQAHDPAAFATKYGTNGKTGSKGENKNALGKCISAGVKHSIDKQNATVTAAAKACKTAKKSDAVKFAHDWGTGANAYGKCVAHGAKTK